MRWKEDQVDFGLLADLLDVVTLIDCGIFTYKYQVLARVGTHSGDLMITMLVIVKCVNWVLWAATMTPCPLLWITKSNRLIQEALAHAGLKPAPASHSERWQHPHLLLGCACLGD